MKRFATLMLAAMFSVGSAFGGELVGWVVDEKCAAEKGASEGHADCAKKCVESGQAIVFLTDADKKIYKIDNQDAVKDHVGAKVTVDANVTGDSIHVNSVKS